MTLSQKSRRLVKKSWNRARKVTGELEIVADGSGSSLILEGLRKSLLGSTACKKRSLFWKSLNNKNIDFTRVPWNYSTKTLLNCWKSISSIGTSKIIFIGGQNRIKHEFIIITVASVEFQSNYKQSSLCLSKQKEARAWQAQNYRVL